MAKKKEAKSKAQPKLVDVVTRVHGPTVFQKSGLSEADARKLVDKHGFRLGARTADGLTLWADMTAYVSYKGV